MSSVLRLVGLAAASLAGVAIGACSAAHEDALVEYPDGGVVPVEADGEADAARAPDGDSGAEASGPIVGKQLLAGSVFFEGVTTDGHLVFEDGKDVKVLPAGSTTPTTFVSDYDSGSDTLLVRGPFIAAWLGGATTTVPLTLWSKTGGKQTVSSTTYASSLYPRNAADDLAYTAPGTDLLHRDVWATKAGAGAGVRALADLDTGLSNAQCSRTIAWSATGLLVAGCPNGSTTPKVGVYAADGSGLTRTVLDGSAPGLWPNHARTHALVQTTTASSIRTLAGATGTVALDGPVKQAVFSSDDTKVVYRQADGKVKRAATTAPSSPVVLFPSSLAILAASSDARFVVAETTGDPAGLRSDILVVDALAPAMPRALATEKAALIGLSIGGTQAVWLADLDLALEGTLYVAALPNGAPQKLSAVAERVKLEGDVVYWQEFDPATKTNLLRAARLASPASIITVDQGLDPLTAQTVVIGKSLFVGSKLGLWQYPALAP